MGLILTEAHMAERFKKITVQWTYPIQYDSMMSDERVYSTGLYYISHKYRNKEKLLYIGQTTDCYKNRFDSHMAEWLFEVRGKIYIRLGTIVYPTYIPGGSYRQIAEDAERALIHEMQPDYNNKATVTYTPNHLYTVTNIGFRGTLPTSISMREHIE